MITKKEYLVAKEIIAEYEKEQEELKELLSRDTISIEIHGFLSIRNNICYYPRSKNPQLNFKGKHLDFKNITDLKKFYGIKKVNKTEEKEWAINNKGNKIEWYKYEAEIPISFLLDSEYYKVEDFKGGVMNQELKLNDKVIYPELYDNEIFTITGITLDKYQLTGDWSGGTHCINQPSWVSKEKNLIKVENFKGGV